CSSAADGACPVSAFRSKPSTCVNREKSSLIQCFPRSVLVRSGERSHTVLPSKTSSSSPGPNAPMLTTSRSLPLSSLFEKPPVPASLTDCPERSTLPSSITFSLGCFEVALAAAPTGSPLTASFELPPQPASESKSTINRYGRRAATL